ncbi:MAG: InlB B-repeat-containing protein, partial [Clostridiales bacterium]|nr:InlB B-repeat-containing protein [Clostridiales bacterium]
MKNRFKQIIAFAMTIALVATTVTFTAGNTIKASNDEGAYTAGQQAVENQDELQVEGENNGQTDEDLQTEEPQEKTEELVLGASGDEITDATEEKSTDSTASQEMPKQTLTAQASDGAQITVSAPKGALPEGSKVLVSSVKKSAVKDAVKDAVEAEGKTLKGLAAYDITIQDSDGNYIQPDKNVKVEISGADINADKADVYHMDGNTPEKVASGVDADNAQFSAGSFSIYVVVDNVTDTSNKKGQSWDNRYEVAPGGSITLTTDNPSEYESNKSWSWEVEERYGSLSNATRNNVVFTAKDNLKEGQNVTVKYSQWWDSDQKFYITIKSAQATEHTLTFNQNGGSESAPTAITEIDGKPLFEGAEVTLPDYSGTRDGKVFVGWSTHNDATGEKLYTKAVYPAGSMYTMGSKSTTLYATWASQNVDAEFYVRLDGQIPTEPQGHDASEYTSKISITGAIKVAEFYTNSTDGVSSRLNKTPTDSQIKAVYKKYDSNTQYVLWYVIKHEDTWHVDGVLLDKAKVNLSYDANAPAGTWSNMPDGKQYAVGATAEVSNKVPIRTDGYTFEGWNTSANGTGTSYSAGNEIVMKNAVTLYAQWGNTSLIRIAAKSVEKVYDGTALVADNSKNGYTVTGNLPEGYRVEAAVKPASQTNVGTADVEIASYTIYDGDGNDVTNQFKNVRTAKGELKVTKRPVTLTSATDSKLYDGTALKNNTVTVGGDKFVKGEGAEYDVTGSQKEAGHSVNAFSYNLKAGTKADNY